MNPTPLTRPRHRRSVTLGLALAVVLLAAACDGEPQAAEPETTPTTPPAEPADTPEPTPTLEPTPTPTDEPEPEPTLEPPGDPEPQLATTGDDLESVIKSRYAYRSWLFRNPHPDNATQRLERITDPDCNCWEPDHELLAYYAEHELWWTGAELKPVSVEVLDRSAPNVAILGIVFERDGTAELIDRSGQVHDELEPRRFYAENVLVREGQDAPWRMLSTSDARPVPGEDSDEGEE